MTATANRAMVERFITEVWNDREYDVIDEVFTDDYTAHWVLPGGTDLDRDGVREFIMGTHQGFSDFEMDIEFIHANDEYVTAGFMSRGTHDGEFMGITPEQTQQPETPDGTPGQITFRFEDGKIVEGWTSWDALGLFMTLGLVPEDLAPEAPPADD